MSHGQILGKWPLLDDSHQSMSGDLYFHYVWISTIGCMTVPRLTMARVMYLYNVYKVIISILYIYSDY